MKRLIAFALVLMLALTLAACGGNDNSSNGNSIPPESTTPSGGNTNTPTSNPPSGGDTNTPASSTPSGGNNDTQPRREDATDFPDGVHSYTYAGHVYEGNWENGLPNGSGTMIKDIVGREKIGEQIYTGIFVDGVLDGMVTVIENYNEGEAGYFTSNSGVITILSPLEYMFEVNMGRALEEEARPIGLGSNDVSWRHGDTVYGMPPFCNFGGNNLTPTTPDPAPTTHGGTTPTTPNTPDPTPTPPTTPPVSNDGFPDETPDILRFIVGTLDSATYYPYSEHPDYDFGFMIFYSNCTQADHDALIAHYLTAANSRLGTGHEANMVYFDNGRAQATMEQVSVIRVQVFWK